MSAYIIVIVNKVTDPAEITEYRRMGAPSMKGRDVKFLVRPGPITTLEGPPAEGVVLLEFPTFEEAKDWYESPVYQEALQHRFKGAECQAFLVKG